MRLEEEGLRAESLQSLLSCQVIGDGISTSSVEPQLLRAAAFLSWVEEGGGLKVDSEEEMVCQ